VPIDTLEMSMRSALGGGDYHQRWRRLAESPCKVRVSWGKVCVSWGMRVHRETYRALAAALGLG